MGELTKARSAFESLTVYRNLLNDETVSCFLRLLTAAEGGDAASFCVAYGEFFHSLANRNASLGGVVSDVRATGASMRRLLSCPGSL